MNNKIKLADIEISQLSTEAITLLSRITLRIRKVSDKRLRFTDPRLLQKVSYKTKRINDPEINALYRQYKTAMKLSVNQALRNHQLAA